MYREALKELATKICQTRDYKFAYGTAGFRDLAKRLDTVMFTTGILSAFRSIQLGGKFVGVMITASHNPPEDNGVKIVEPNGNMLIQNWEPKITNLVNLSANDSFENWYKAIEEFQNEIGIVDQITKIKPQIVVAYDSRESSPFLLDCLIQTINCFFGENNVNIVNHGLLTTPQLHFLTSLQDDKATEDDYNKYFQTQWDNLFQTDDKLPFDNLYIDTANGVGSVQIAKFLENWTIDHTKIKITNNDYLNPEKLNVGCGADFVKTNQRLPHGLENITDNGNNLYCSYDGDADRIVFYYISSKDGKFKLLDGDKIATLFAKYLSQLLSKYNLQDSLKLGVVQTAYANGSSTHYLINKLGLPVSCTKTGVKHLHHEAVTKYDIGVYFEANGHGTIVFSDHFHDIIKQNPKAQDLLYFSHIINQTVGDAISDMLGVLITLVKMQWSADDWDSEYQDLPNLLTKLVVPDRTVFQTFDQERQLSSPKGLQDKINETVGKFDMGRSFVRASGTEDAVRIYCESETNVADLSKEITKLVVDSVN